MASPFERFRFSFFEDPDLPRNGLDMKALAALEGEERSRAEDMLLQYLPDTRGVIGLGALGSRRAGPALVQLFEASQGSDSSEQVYLAKAIWQIQPNPRWLAAVIEVLASADEPMRRLTAAEALYDFRDPVTVGALVKALDDPEGLVRHHARPRIARDSRSTRQFQRPAAHDVPGDVGRRRTARGRQAGHPRGHRRAVDLRAMSSAAEAGAGRKPVVRNVGERGPQPA
jgi:hypothetical protein